MEIADDNFPIPENKSMEEWERIKKVDLHFNKIGRAHV